MSEETKSETMTGVEGLKPAFIEGQDAGSTYQVVVRTSRGYVGVRRLSKYIYRVRCERFDKKPLLTVNDQALMVILNQMKLKVGNDAIRISGTFNHQAQALDACACLTSVLVSNENELETMPHCSDPDGLAYDAKIEAHKALKKAAAGDVDALNRDPNKPAVLVPVDPGDEVN